MALITLVGKTLAEPGREFYYMGPLTDCKDCRLKAVCFNLEQGCRYRIVAVRPQEHDCREFDGDKAVAVEIEKVPTPAAVPRKLAIEGGLITFQKPKCMNLGCPNFGLCNPTGKVDGTKITVLKTKGEIECPAGDRIVAVDVI